MTPRARITPMIDVMLALLLIFMVMTPVLTAYEAEPPEAIHVVPETLADAVTLGIDRGGTYYLGEEAVAPEALDGRLRSLYAERPGDHVLYLRSDRAVRYGVVLEAIRAARRAGVRTIGAIAVPADEEAVEAGSLSPGEPRGEVE